MADTADRRHSGTAAGDAHPEARLREDGGEEEREPLHLGHGLDGVTILPLGALVATKADLLALDVDPAEAAMVAGNVKAGKGFSQRRQFCACIAVQALSVVGGVCIAHSSSLIPALMEDGSGIPITRQQGAWIASVLVLAVPVGALVSLALGNVLGRLALVRAMSLPYCAGWALIATAGSLPQVIVGRLLLGVSLGLAHSPLLLYVSEVADKNIRGGLSAIGTALASLGVLLCYVMGAFMDWRTHAWANCALPVVPLVAIMVSCTESPVWLRARGRVEAAAEASAFLYNDPEKVVSVPSKPGKPPADGKPHRAVNPWKMLFTDPMAYKPLIIVNLLFIIQQIVGIYITIYFAVPLFKETGSTIDPYIASILIGVVRVVGCTAVSLVMSRLGRRPLMIVSSVGQAASMAVSGAATHFILRGDDVSSSWVMAGVLGYIAFGCLGWQAVPWCMMAEVFPHEVRSLAQPLNSSTAHVYMFLMLQLYPTLQDLVGGAAGIQLLFAGASLLSAVFVWVLLPETRGRTLADIEQYFRDNDTFLQEKRRKRALRAAA